MKNKWDERYAQEEYIYGKEPNVYLREKLEQLTVGRILFPAEGEGRNAVYAAKKGWEVEAFDASKEGKKKAEKLAIKNQVTIKYERAKVEDINFQKENFDVIALIYAHFPTDRRSLHQKLSTYLKPGGYLILEAFNKKHVKNQQLNPHAGGPKNIDLLYDLEELKSDFDNFEFLEAANAEINLQEGKNHVGEAAVVRVFGVKK